MLKLRRRHRVSSSAVLPLEVSGGISATGTLGLDVKRGGTLEQQVAALWRQVDSLRESLDAETAQRTAAIAEAQRASEEQLHEGLEGIVATLDRYKRRRLVGFALIVMGAALVNVGNFL